MTLGRRRITLPLRGGGAPSKPGGRQDWGTNSLALAPTSERPPRPYHLPRRLGGNEVATTAAKRLPASRDGGSRPPSSRDMERGSANRGVPEYSPRNRRRPPEARVWRYRSDLRRSQGHTSVSCEVRA